MSGPHKHDSGSSGRGRGRELRPLTFRNTSGKHKRRRGLAEVDVDVSSDRVRFARIPTAYVSQNFALSLNSHRVGRRGARGKCGVRRAANVVRPDVDVDVSSGRLRFTTRVANINADTASRT